MTVHICWIGITLLVLFAAFSIWSAMRDENSQFGMTGCLESVLISLLTIVGVLILIIYHLTSHTEGG